MKFLNVILGSLAALSFVLALWQWLAARRFPLHQRLPPNSQSSTLNPFAPALTLLKPLKGCDNTTADSLRSWFRQNYSGQIQILFGVADADDRACKIIQQLLRQL